VHYRLLVFGKGVAVECKAEMQTLAIAQLNRSEAQLRELMESEKALYEIDRCIKDLYDWGSLRRAKRDVLCWEARCVGAEIALKRCVERTTD